MAKQTKKVTKRRVRIVEVGVCEKCRQYMSKGKKKNDWYFKGIKRSTSINNDKIC